MRGHSRAFEPVALIDALGGWLAAHGPALQRHPGTTRLDLSDAIHFCSHAIKQEPIDLLLSHFDRICVAGRPASVPYIRKRLAALGRTYLNIPSYAPEIVQAVEEPFDCLLICGAMGDFKIEGPAVALQHVGLSWRALNLERFGTLFEHLRVHGAMEDMPDSGHDWHHSGTLEWGRERAVWAEVRMASARGEPA